MVPKIEYTTCRDFISKYYGCILNQIHESVYDITTSIISNRKCEHEVGGGVQHLRVTRSNMVTPGGETVKHGHPRG